jgi:hypothetical protein
MWNYEGLRVSGDYLGFPVTGVVNLSRVAFGGDIKHTVVLDEQLQLPWRNELTDCVILSMKEITRVMS